MQHCKHADQVKHRDDANLSYKLLCHTVTESLYVCLCVSVQTNFVGITVTIYNCACREKIYSFLSYAQV